MGSAADSVIARHARENALCLITRDKDFGDIRNYPPGDYGGIIVLDLPDDVPAIEVLRILEVFLSHKDWSERLSGRLAIVEPSRVRFRPS
jgi:predicted nuclease of predicted toxin-antitoxin system